MTGMPLGLIIEGLVAVLLLMTIGFCIALNRRLASLRADQSALQHTVAELDAATIRAERAIQGLRVAAGEANGALTQQMRHADKMARDLERQVQGANGVLTKIMAISRAGERPAPAPMAAPMSRDREAPVTQLRKGEAA